MGRRSLIAAVAFLLPVCAWAQGTIQGEVRVVTVDKAGKRVTKDDHSDVVVFLTGFKQDPPDTIPTVRQEGRQFVPRIVPIVAGQSIQYRNDDRVLHNVFANSSARKFDLGKKDFGEYETVKFSRTGLVDVYCDIHEQMSMTVIVLPNRAFALSAKDGRFEIKDVPAGEHPLRAFKMGDQAEAKVKVENGKVAKVVLEVVETERPAHKDKHGKSYETRSGYK